MCLIKYKMRQNYLALVLAFMCVVSLSMAGCHRKVVVTDLPAGVSQKEVLDWYTATGVLQEVGAATETATNTTREVFKTLPDAITGDNYMITMTALGRLSQVGIHAKNVLAAQPENFGKPTKVQIAQLLDDMVAQLDQAAREDLSYVKNEQHRQSLLNSITRLRAAIKVLRALTATT